jgi:molecular chaperone DnaK
MTPEAQGKVGDAVATLEAALKGTDVAAIKSAIDGLNRVWSEASTQMYQQQASTPPPQQGGDGASHDGKVENADYTVVDEEKK